MEYSDEPRLVFTPLSQEDYCRFYSLEMEGFTDDAAFYRRFLLPDSRLLELGCGTGRLTRLLSGSCRSITALDNSLEMIRLARGKQFPAHTSLSIKYLHQDMLEMSFSNRFDIIVIPYNTLNLLGDPNETARCLELCRNSLVDGGQLLLHLYHPSVEIVTSENEHFFQFDILDDTQGGKVIKETLKSYHQDCCRLQLEERYRVRPAPGCGDNRDLRHILNLYAPPFAYWEELLGTKGFSVDTVAGRYDGTSFQAHDDTRLLMQAIAI